jgi:hypothetical protein
MKSAIWGSGLVAALTACSFPEIDFADTSTSSSGGGQGGSSTASTTATTTTTATTATTTSGTGGGDSCTPGDCGTSADKDRDGYADQGCVGGSGSGGGGGGSLPYNDCDDCDLDAHPGQTGFFTTERKGNGGYDYDCDGNEVYQYPTAAQCSDASGCPADLLLSTQPVLCGQTGALGHCKVFLGCVKDGDAMQQVKQGCH